MGVKTLYEYFYKLTYGDKGADKATLVNDCLDVADAEIKANKDAKHTRNTDTALATLTTGIPFPATQVPSANANTLDDYEEGTWTIGVSFDGNAVGITYSSNAGYYTKIGNTVTISGYMCLTSKGSSTGIARITGLPFTVVNNSAGYTAAPVSLIGGITFAGQFQAWTAVNTTTIELWEITGTGIKTGIEDTDFANNSEIIIGCIYRVN